MLTRKRFASTYKNCEFPDDGGGGSGTTITSFQKVSLCTYNLNGESQHLRISAKALFLPVLLGLLFSAHMEIKMIDWRKIDLFFHDRRSKNIFIVSLSLKRYLSNHDLQK